MSAIDIVVPCYNYSHFLEDCVGSILTQSVTDLRVLIIDDASRDNSVAVARRLALADPRVTVVAHARNKGHIATFNSGIAWANGKYFLLISADDVLAPGALERAIKLMDEHPEIVLTYGDIETWREGDPRPAIKADAPLEWSRTDLIGAMCRTATNFVSTPTAIVRGVVQKAVGGYNPTLPHTADLEMWLRLASHGEVAYIRNVQAIYRRHGDAMSNPYLSDVLPDYLQRWRGFVAFFDRADSSDPRMAALRQSTSRALADQAFRHGIDELRRGRLKQAKALIGWAIKLYPPIRFHPPIGEVFRIPTARGVRAALSRVRHGVSAPKQQTQGSSALGATEHID